MQALLEFAPIVVFVAAYVAGGLYVATGALMLAMLALLLIDLARERRIPPMHAISAVLVFVFGAATLILRSPEFIQWKPTVFYWLVSLALLGSHWIGEKVLVQRLLGAALNDVVRAPDSAWRRLNALWAVFYALLGVANLGFVYFTSLDVWTYSKPFFVVVVLVFTGASAAWLMKRHQATPEQQGSSQA
jgi:intracellular septation protein